MAFQKGNQLAVKSKLFDGALKRAIAQDDGKKLRAAAESLLTQAASGEAWAIRELADRLDGKSQAHVSVETKNVSDLSLSELVAEIAGIAGRGDEAAAGPAESGAVH